MNFEMVCKDVYNFPLINYSRFRLSTVLCFATIEFDEARPKVFFCIHKKLIYCLLLRSAPYLIVIDHVSRIREEIGGRNIQEHGLL